MIVTKLMGRWRGWLTLMVGALALQCVGCGTESWWPQGGETARAKPQGPKAATPYRYKSQSTVGQEPAQPTKAIEDRKEFRERHPSLWRRKLKATFT